MAIVAGADEVTTGADVVEGSKIGVGSIFSCLSCLAFREDGGLSTLANVVMGVIGISDEVTTSFSGFVEVTSRTAGVEVKVFSAGVTDGGSKVLSS